MFKRLIKNRTVNPLFFGAALIAGLFCFTSSASAATFVVNTTADTLDAAAGDGACADSTAACSLRAAISEANAFPGADIITLPAGTYSRTLTASGENANASGDYDIISDITINGAGSGTSIIQADAAPNTALERVFHIFTGAATVVINDVTVRHGNTAINSSGSGLRLESNGLNLTLNRLVITANRSAGAGGGISYLGTPMTVAINDSTISNNTAGSNVAGSGSTGAGIAVQTVSTTTITNTVINGNTINTAVAGTSAFGAGVSITGGAGTTVTLTGSTVSNNTSTVSIAGAGAAFAGGIYNQQSTLNLIRSTVSGNSVTNTATPANAFHGGIRALAQTVPATTNITDSTVSGNTAVGEGGGVVNASVGAAASTLNFVRSTISGNTVTGAAGAGGGIEQFATSTGVATTNLTNSTVSTNSAANGAGIYNVATAAAPAAAIVNLNFSTVAFNTAASGGGIFQDATGTTNLKNSIVSNNTAGTGPNILGTITSQNYNHVQNPTGGTFAALANDVVGTDPLLGPLANNSGPTQTHVPAAASPVVNAIPAGTNDCGTVVTNDQRGVVRPQAACEKGSVELGPTAAGVSVGGRVIGVDGRGLTNARVAITDERGNTSTMITGRNGAFRFDDIQPGQTYVISVGSRRYEYVPQVFQVTESLSHLVFTPANGGISDGRR